MVTVDKKLNTALWQDENPDVGFLRNSTMCSDRSHLYYYYCNTTVISSSRDRCKWAGEAVAWCWWRGGREALLIKILWYLKKYCFKSSASLNHWPEQHGLSTAASFMTDLFSVHGPILGSGPDVWNQATLAEQGYIRLDGVTLLTHNTILHFRLSDSVHSLMYAIG